jgi:hypothetical protein
MNSLTWILLVTLSNGQQVEMARFETRRACDNARAIVMENAEADGFTRAACRQAVLIDVRG